MPDKTSETPSPQVTELATGNAPLPALAAQPAETARALGGIKGAGTGVNMWNLARKLLLHDRLRFAVAIAGVSVSVMLVLVQVSLYFGFMDTASSIIDASHADIWVGKKSNESFEFATPFDERAFYKVASVPGVAHAERVLMNFAQFKLADGGDLGVQVVGIETAPGHRPLLAPWNVIAGDASRLAEPGAIVLDKSEYAKLKIDRVGHLAEISGVRAEVVALTSGIRSFTTSPIIFTDLRTARSYLPQLGDEPVTYVLVEVAPGTSVADVKARIDALPQPAARRLGERGRTAGATQEQGDDKARKHHAPGRAQILVKPMRLARITGLGATQWAAPLEPFAAV
jgi:hypothetical protein